MTTISDGTTTITPTLVTGYQTTRSSRNVFHDILGRPDPDVTLAPAALRSGTLHLLFETEADAVAAITLHTGAATLSLLDADVPSIGMSYAIDGSIEPALEDQTRAVWTIDVGYREVLQ